MASALRQVQRSPGGGRSSRSIERWKSEGPLASLRNDTEVAPAARPKAAALSELGERQISAIARNDYLSAAQYLPRD
jgi:hypothetical protein